VETAGEGGRKQEVASPQTQGDGRLAGRGTMRQAARR
jgi:hypothetical protein